MKICILTFALTITLVISSLGIQTSAADELYISAHSAVLINADDGSVLFEKNSDEKLPMASTTKIMTAIIAIENGDLSKEFAVDERAVGVEGTSAYLQKGDKLTLESALYALLLQSANDAAVAIACEISKSTEDFVGLMNQKCADLGLSCTHFENPNGLPSSGHYTTAKELAYLAAYCMKNETFAAIVSKKSADININGAPRTFVNHNRLLSMYNDCIGIKTGYTQKSGRCLVSAAEREGCRLIAVTLNAPNDWNDHKKLFDHGFGKYRSYLLFDEESFIFEIPVAGSSKSIRISPDGSQSCLLKNGSHITTRLEAPHIITAPIKKGRTLGYAVFECDGKEICRTPLKAREDI